MIPIAAEHCLVYDINEKLPCHFKNSITSRSTVSKNDLNKFTYKGLGHESIQA